MRDPNPDQPLLPFSSMQTQVYERQAGPSDWLHHVIALLDAAMGHLHQEQAAHGTLREATSLLRRQVAPRPVEGAAEERTERLLAWQARKVLDYIDGHISGRVLVADLCALVWRSQAHFSRAFRSTFGCSPHAFVIRRRVELAAKYMLESTMSLSEIALACGFVDQAHLSRHFRAQAGETPAAWRRARR
jgi:AraC family transcriptional regulator